MSRANTETFCPANRQEWRRWLEENHCTKPAVGLICYKKSAGIPTINWSDAVDEALCFGWIDNTRVSIGEDRFIQYFGKRKPKSAWSRINKEKVTRLIKEGLMTPAGYESIETARKNGSWNLLDEVEDLVVPDDLLSAFENRPGAGAFFHGLSKSVRKAMLQWLVLARKPETRLKRISEITDYAATGRKPPQFR